MDYKQQVLTLSGEEIQLLCKDFDASSQPGINDVLKERLFT